MPNWHPTFAAFSAHFPSLYFSGTSCSSVQSSTFTSWLRRLSHRALPSSSGFFSTESSTRKPGLRYSVSPDMKGLLSTSLTKLKQTSCRRKNLWIEGGRPKLRKEREEMIYPSLWECHFTGYLNSSSSNNRLLSRTTLSPLMTFRPFPSAPETLKRPDQDRLQEQVCQEDQVKALWT